MPSRRVADRSPASPAAAHSPLKNSSSIVPAAAAKVNSMAAAAVALAADDNDNDDADEGTDCRPPSAPAADVPSPSAKRKQQTEKEEEERRRERELCKLLLCDRERLEETLVRRLTELKRVCIAEGELTGQMPDEIYKTLLPGEPEPQVKRRVGTAFKIPHELLQRRNDSEDQIGQLEAEVELNRRLVAAAERLASDKSANKSLRRKRRKELQAAAQRLKGLERGLNRMRLSSSKPDVSSLGDGGWSFGRHNAGSGFSLNSLKTWPNFYNSIRMSTKSCPNTPRGSVPDLSVPAIQQQQQTGCPSGSSKKTTPTAAKKLHNLLRGGQQPNGRRPSGTSPSAPTTTPPPPRRSPPPPLSGAPSSSSSLSASSLLNDRHHSPPCRTTISATTSTSSGISSAAYGSSSNASCSNLMTVTAPPVPVRRTSAGSFSSPANGRRQSSDSAADQPAVILGGQFADTHLYANIGYTSSVPYMSAYRQSNFPTMHTAAGRRINSAASAVSTSFSPAKRIMQIGAQGSRQQPPLPPTSLAEEAGDELGRIVRQLDSAAPHSLLLPPTKHSLSASALLHPRCNNNHISSSGTRLLASSSSTASLDRRTLRAAVSQRPMLLVRHHHHQQQRGPAADYADCGTMAVAASNCPSSSMMLPPSLQPSMSTTFPVNETIRPMESGDFARFRSISAVLDHHQQQQLRRTDNGQQQQIEQQQKRSSPRAVAAMAIQHQKQLLPARNERMEALLASIQIQKASSRSSSIARRSNASGGTPPPAPNNSTTATVV